MPLLKLDIRKLLIFLFLYLPLNFLFGFIKKRQEASRRDMKRQYQPN